MTIKTDRRRTRRSADEAGVAKLISIAQSSINGAHSLVGADLLPHLESELFEISGRLLKLYDSIKEQPDAD